MTPIIMVELPADQHLFRASVVVPYGSFVLVPQITGRSTTTARLDVRIGTETHTLYTLPEDKTRWLDPLASVYHAEPRFDSPPSHETPRVTPEEELKAQYQALTSVLAAAYVRALHTCSEPLYAEPVVTLDNIREAYYAAYYWRIDDAIDKTLFYGMQSLAARAGNPNRDEEFKARVAALRAQREAKRAELR